MRRRCRFSGDLKAKVALEAFRGDRTLQEIASKHQVHPNQVSTWKRQAIEGAWRGVLKRCGAIITDRLRSYRAALRELGGSGLQQAGRWLNNRAEWTWT